MILEQFDYIAPNTLSGAVAALTANPESSALAGGDGLITLLKRGQLRPTLLVDLQHIEALRGIHLFGDGKLRIGAMTTLAGLLTEQAVRLAHLPGVLGEAVEQAGDPQARNRATVGGTLAAGHPGSHLAAALLALDARANLVGPGGHRTAPVGDLLDLGGTGRLARGELIVSVELPPAEQGSGYELLADRATLDAVCGVGVTVSLAPDGTLAGCRVAVTGSTMFPRRLPAVEAALTGSVVPLTVPAITADFLDDRLGSAEYRAEITRVLTGRALTRAIARAKAS
jgi:aerobic carbon-monoxide dehydrogenase medium subunit